MAWIKGEDLDGDSINSYKLKQSCTENISKTKPVIAAPGVKA